MELKDDWEEVSVVVTRSKRLRVCSVTSQQHSRHGNVFLFAGTSFSSQSKNWSRAQWLPALLSSKLKTLDLVMFLKLEDITRYLEAE